MICKTIFVVKYLSYLDGDLSCVQYFRCIFLMPTRTSRQSKYIFIFCLDKLSFCWVKLTMSTNEQCAISDFKSGREKCFRILLKKMFQDPRDCFWTKSRPPWISHSRRGLTLYKQKLCGLAKIILYLCV